MRALRVWVRSWPLLVAGVAGLAGAVALFALRDLALNPFGPRFAAFALAAVSIGSVAGSLFETRRDRLLIVALGLLLGLAMTLPFGSFWWPMTNEQRADRLVWSEYFDAPGKPLPDVTLTDLDGGTLSLGDLRGSMVLVDFWHEVDGGWTAEHLALRRLAHEELADEGLVIVGISTVPAERQRELRREHRVPYRLVVDEGASRRAFRFPQDVYASALADREGTIREIALDGMLGLHRVVRAVRGSDWDPRQDPVPAH